MKETLPCFLLPSALCIKALCFLKVKRARDDRPKILKLGAIASFCL
ncbi:MAG: hypothetical protein ICV63_08230 [Coleofasciculus sp. Co-bin14]|nr:hypothetical protein [Coleofasciculus sp. Co-bin14]